MFIASPQISLLESIIHSIEAERNYSINNIPIVSFSWNPYVYLKDGSKKYYQRDFVWSLEQKQNLVESIYNGIDCGKVLVRKHSWNDLTQKQKNGETELAFKDIIDGKQRLNAVIEFIHNKFVDNHRNFFNDLSNYAQHKFLDHQLISYSEVEQISDNDVLKQFLKLNFEGVPQSKEHLSYVRDLINS